MGVYASAEGVITIPVERQAEAVRALKRNAEERQDAVPDSDNLVTVFEELLDAQDTWCSLEGEQLTVGFYGRIYEYQDAVIAALAPFATEGRIVWDGEDDDYWLNRIIDGVVHTYDGTIVYPESPYEEDH